MADGPNNAHIICGDFNAWQGNPVYQVAKEGYLNDESMAQLQAMANVAMPDGSVRTSRQKKNYKYYEQCRARLQYLQCIQNGDITFLCNQVLSMPFWLILSSKICRINFTGIMLVCYKITILSVIRILNETSFTILLELSEYKIQDERISGNFMFCFDRNPHWWICGGVDSSTHLITWSAHTTQFWWVGIF